MNQGWRKVRVSSATLADGTQTSVRSEVRNETALLPVCVPTHARRGHHADENELRKSFTVTERLAIAQRIAERLGMRQGQRTDLPTSGNISLSEAGQTRDLAAAKAGLGSGKTLEAAQKVVEHGTPELVAAMDEGIQRLETLPGWSISSSS